MVTTAGCNTLTSSCRTQQSRGQSSPKAHTLSIQGARGEGSGSKCSMVCLLSNRRALTQQAVHIQLYEVEPPQSLMCNKHAVTESGGLRLLLYYYYYKVGATQGWGMWWQSPEGSHSGSLSAACQAPPPGLAGGKVIWQCL